jgi:RNA 3'-phosphate cyclase
MLEIDGAFGEGGGQIIRSSVALSAFTGTPIKIHNIRAKRSKPGLSNQHITAIKAVSKLCNGQHSELKVGTSELEFKPGSVEVRDFKFDIGTAGSITLVLQSCLIPILFSGSDKRITITMTGGTDVKWSPPMDYFRQIFCRHLERFGVDIKTKIIQRGYYPQGGGEVEMKVKPKKTYQKPDLSKRGELKKILGFIHLRNLQSHITDRIIRSATKGLSDYTVEFNLDTEKGGYSIGTGLVLDANYDHTDLGASALGDKGISAESLGATAAADLITEMNGDGILDIYSVDQLVPFLAILGVTFSVRELSLHAKTNIWLVERFLDKSAIIEKSGKLVKVSWDE